MEPTKARAPKSEKIRLGEGPQKGHNAPGRESGGRGAEEIAPPPEPVLILGLGNPGPEYQDTRHNLGALAVARLAGRHGMTLSPGGQRARGFKALWAKGLIRGRKAILALPQAYMNRSGQSAAALASYFDLGREHLLVAHDDLDLPLGRMKLVLEGGSGGHKGVKSITDSLGTGRFMRLKLGIGRPRHQETVEDFVLEGFYADQRAEVLQLVESAADFLEEVISSGPGPARQKFHRSSLNGG